MGLKGMDLANLVAGALSGKGKSKADESPSRDHPEDKMSNMEDRPQEPLEAGSDIPESMEDALCPDCHAKIQALKGAKLS